jgi:hypothetical protein
MATERRRKALLGLLVVALLAWTIYQLLPATSTAPPASSNRQAVATRGTGRAEQAAPSQGTPGAPDVHLEALEAEKPKPTGTDRNLFRYKPKAPPPPPPAPPKAAEPVVTGPPAPVGPPPPPPVPPIPLKFIGIMGPENGKIAVLSDSKGPPIPAKEGELVLGQYRVLKIGVESVEVAYADGRGRVTLRLSGQP